MQSQNSAQVPHNSVQNLNGNLKYNNTFVNHKQNLTQNVQNGSHNYQNLPSVQGLPDISVIKKELFNQQNPVNVQSMFQNSIMPDNFLQEVEGGPNSFQRNQMFPSGMVPGNTQLNPFNMFNSNPMSMAMGMGGLANPFMSLGSVFGGMSNPFMQNMNMFPQPADPSSMVLPFMKNMQQMQMNQMLSQMPTNQPQRNSHYNPQKQSQIESSNSQNEDVNSIFSSAKSFFDS